MLWVGCSERTTPGRCRNSSGRMPTQQGLRRTSNTRFSSLMNRHVWVGSSSKPSAKNSIHASRTVSAPPSTGPMDFMEEWIRIVSFPVSPIAARSCLRSAFVYAMSFLLFGRFVYLQFTAFRAAKQACTQKGTCPAASAGDDPVSVGYLSFQLFQQNPVYNISTCSAAATASAVLFYCNI